jgi:hypothetical protein
MLCRRRAAANYQACTTPRYFVSRRDYSAESGLHLTDEVRELWTGRTKIESGRTDSSGFGENVWRWLSQAAPWAACLGG